jgi:hypothetical protein
MDRLSYRVVLEDFRYTLRVMDEASHLGLDDEAASRLRGVLLRRISRLEDALAHESNGSTAAGRASTQES